ncbi:MAG: MBL fold metallo-hydrolase [Clostridia bacterium]|nr:MBL fold metallo-hydrolase [Clostridia bacterium]
MKITYVYHSSFMIEDVLTNGEKVVLLFDYFKGELPAFDRNAYVYMFASHKHPDHFTLDLFRDFKDCPNIKFYLGNDIKLSDSYLERKGIDPGIKSRIVRMPRHTMISDHGIVIETLDSTDQGVAFLVSYDGKTIFHAGDLNWWYWEGETAQEKKSMEKRFKQEIDRLKGRPIDVAFFPTDPRLEAYYDYGLSYLCEISCPKMIFPMHMWEQYEVIQRLKNDAKHSQYADRIQAYI